MWYRDKGSWYSLIIRLTVSSSIVKNRKVNKLRNTSSYFISKEIIKNEINLTLCIYLIMLQSHGVRQGHLVIKLPRNTHFTSHTWLPLCKKRYIQYLYFSKRTKVFLTPLYAHDLGCILTSTYTKLTTNTPKIPLTVIAVTGQHLHVF